MRGTASGQYSASTDFGDVRTATISGLEMGTWYFAIIRHLSGSGQNFTSNEVRVQLGAPSPTPTPAPTPLPTPTPPVSENYSQWIDRLTAWIQQNPPTPNITANQQAEMMDQAEPPAGN
jgi:hypothetical protein